MNAFPDLAALVALTRAAGERILAIREAGFAVDTKQDCSPVTRADRESEALILAGLADIAPGIPAIAEEAAAAGLAPEFSAGPCWLVDPLDGSREFIAGHDSFTVNIGLVDDGRPVLGVMGVPARGEVWTANGYGTARRHPASGPSRAVSARSVPAAGAVVLASRSHGDNERLEAWLGDRPVAEVLRTGSALKFALLAAGEADLYPRFGPTMEWDTAAGQAILEAAGGRVETVDGGPLRYGKPELRNPPFIARGRPE